MVLSTIQRVVVRHASKLKLNHIIGRSISSSRHNVLCRQPLGGSSSINLLHQPPNTMQIRNLPHHPKQPPTPTPNASPSIDVYESYDATDSTIKANDRVLNAFEEAPMKIDQGPKNLKLAFGLAGFVVSAMYISRWNIQRELMGEEGGSAGIDWKSKMGGCMFSKK